MAVPMQYGVTPPLSTAAPTERDIKLNETLTQELKAQKNFPSDEDKARKEAIISNLKLLLRRMVRQVGEKKGLPQAIIDAAGGEVYPYGSHRLGVFQNGSDIDALMVAPKHCTREDFFDIMPTMLKEARELKDVTEPNPVPGISVPIIKVDIEGVDIDLIFCSLSLSSIPEKLDLTDTNLLRGLDTTDIRCVNGTRVTNRILQLIPHTSTFRLALRAVKLWAQRRALYGNIVGFPGGVAYAMMVARICQLYPMAAAPLIVQKFFFVMKRWNWPSPVRLQAPEDASLQLRQWDPNTSRADAHHLMPVITPSYPVQNSAHTITESTKKVMLLELDRGHNIVTDVYAGKTEWKDLFNRHTFFTSTYKHFICVITGSKNEAEQRSWTGHVLSKLKFLAAGIEHSDGRSVEVVQPFNKGFDRVHDCKGLDDIEKSLDGDLSCQVLETKMTEQTNSVKVQATSQAEAMDTATTESKETSSPNGADSVERVYTTTYYLGIGLKKGANSLDLSSPIQEFKEICLRWEKYDQSLNSVRIKYMKKCASTCEQIVVELQTEWLTHCISFDLPDDVFVEGETRPVRTKKAKANNKRNVAQAGLEAPADSAKRQQSTNGSGSLLPTNGVPTAINGTTTSSIG